MQINQALELAIKELKNAGIQSAVLDAEVLLCHNLKPPLNPLLGKEGKDKAWFYSNLDYELSKLEESKYKKYISRRAKSEPVAYIINKKEFYGLDFYVNKNVLIPRPETELLVEECLKICKNASQRVQVVVEIGTGSGCVAIAVAKNLSVNIIATDISNKTLRVAKKNAKIHKVDNKIKFIKNDLLSGIKNIKPDIVIANLPYLTPVQYKNNPDLKYEPKNALVGGIDGLEYIKKLLQQISKLKYKPKYVLLEIDPEQKSKIKKIPFGIGKVKIKFVKDLNGRDRVVVVKLVF